MNGTSAIREYVIKFGSRFFQGGIGIVVSSLLLCSPSALSSTREKKTTKPSCESQVVASRVVPFWKAKEKVYEQMREERRIPVSAKTDVIGENPTRYKLQVEAAGLVKATGAQSFDIVTDFERLTEVDERFQEVKWDSERQRLFVHAAALNYHAKMLMALTFACHNKINDIQFEVIDGHFKGMKGVIRLEDDGRQNTEISFSAEYESEKLPLPKVLMGFGLELVGQKVASKMREYIEGEVKKRK